MCVLVCPFGAAKNFNSLCCRTCINDIYIVVLEATTNFFSTSKFAFLKSKRLCLYRFQPSCSKVWNNISIMHNHVHTHTCVHKPNLTLFETDQNYLLESSKLSSEWALKTHRLSLSFLFSLHSFSNSSQMSRIRGGKPRNKNSNCLSVCLSVQTSAAVPVCIY